MKNVSEYLDRVVIEEEKTMEKNKKGHQPHATVVEKGGCPFVFKTPKEVNVTIVGERGVRTEQRLFWEEVRCGSPSDGINGYCSLHSYPILKPVAKSIPVRKTRVVQNVMGGYEQENYEEVSMFVWNIGEHLDPGYFTDEEIKELFNMGLIGKRVSNVKVLSAGGGRDVSDEEIETLLKNFPEEKIISLIKDMEFSPMSLLKISAKAKKDSINEAIKQVLDSSTR